MKRLALALTLMMVFCAASTFAAPKKGTMKDSRDGKTYKTVQISSQTWMAENLNYKAEKSFCYKDDAANCAKYGRLYTWKTAQKACPAGWHLPSRAEWETLIVAVDGSIVKYALENTAGSKLKSSSGWKENGNGTDAFGFSALPVGTRSYDGRYYSEGDVAYFWNSTEDDSDFAQHVSLLYRNDDAGLGWFSKDYAFSVRCLKD